MKKNFIIGTVLTGMLLAASPVEAMGNAKVVFSGNDTIKVGETFTVSMSVTDINDTYDGVVSLGGNLSFDSTMIEYVSSKGVETPYLFQINEDYAYKIAGLDFTLDNGILETLTVYEFTFKALKEGNTTITLENAKLTDSQDYINTTIVGKEISIEEKEEITKETQIVEIKEETPATVVEVNEEVIIQEKTVVETRVEQTVNTVNKEEKTDTVETKKEVNTEVKEDIIEENNDKKEEKNVEKIESKEEKETFIEKVQKVFSDLFTKLRDLFR